jgi:hypothetical protein
MTMNKTLESDQLWYNLPDIQPRYDSISDPSVRFGWVHFNLSAYYVGAITIKSARLYIYGSSIALNRYSYSVKYDAYGIAPSNETWVANTITWLNQPSLLSLRDHTNDVVLSSPPQYLEFDLVTTNASLGTQALQTAYDGNLTKSYCIINVYDGIEIAFNSMEATSNKPKLVIDYDLVEGGESTMSAPTVLNGVVYDLVYYPYEDTRVTTESPTTPIGYVTHGKVQYIASTSERSDILSHFNVSRPSLVNGVSNNGTLSLKNTDFAIYQLSFSMYCYVVVDPYGFNNLQGVFRSNETWSHSTVTWNTKPIYRSGFLSTNNYVDKTGMITWNILSEGDYIRYSIMNNYNYTVVNTLDSNFYVNSYNEWLMQGDPSAVTVTVKPYISMRILASNLTAPSTSVLAVTNWHVALAYELGLTPYGEVGNFTAGALLSSFFFMAITVPLCFIAKNKLFRFILILAPMTIFMWFGWLHIGLYLIIALLCFIYLVNKKVL